jgi:hypothetical protein
MVPASAWPGSTGKATALTSIGQGAAVRFLFGYFSFPAKEKVTSTNVNTAHPIPNEEPNLR